MGNSGIGMLLGDASASMLRLWVIGAFVLGAMLVYAATKAGYLRPGERARLDRATEERQRQEDPFKRPG